MNSKAILLATTVFSIALSASAIADSYYFRAKQTLIGTTQGQNPPDETPGGGESTSPLTAFVSGPASVSLGQSLGAHIVAEGGQGPYTFTQASGDLPPGVAFEAATGAISGLPSYVGDYSAVFGVSDTAGVSVQAAYSVVIPSAILSLGVSGQTTMQLGESLAAQVNASGGTAPYSYAIIAGNFPGDVALNQETGAISGTPSVDGSFSATIQVVDASGSSGAVIAGFTISAPPAVIPGSQTFIASGNFTVPAFNTLVIEGVGGGGVGYNSSPNSDGNSTSIATLSLLANGGKQGGLWTGGAGGTASGGDVNIAGATGAGLLEAVPYVGGKGAGPFGGLGGVIGTPGSGEGSAPGGGGIGYSLDQWDDNTGQNYVQWYPCGGGGGYFKKTYTAQSLAVGTVLNVNVAAAIIGSWDGLYGHVGSPYSAGGGARGEVRFTWN